MSITLHETLYRGARVMQALESTSIVLCGAGALGSILGDNLARHGARQLTIIDYDRVEEHNIGTQIYERGEIGAFKAEVLAARIFRATGTEANPMAKELNEKNVAKLLRGAGVVLDCFDNSASRRLVTEHCRAQSLECLHLGLHTEYGEVRWNAEYLVPNDGTQPAACDYPLARNLVLLVAALGAEDLLHFLATGEHREHSVTLKDVFVNREN